MKALDSRAIITTKKKIKENKKITIICQTNKMHYPIYNPDAVIPTFTPS